MEKIPFDEKELTIVAEYPDRIPGRTGPTREYARPVTEKENYRMMYEGKPMWLTGRNANICFAPKIFPDNIARGFVFDGSGFDNNNGGGKDMFGVQWKWIPEIGASLEDPDVPHLFEDANDWEKVLQFPDIDSWDWEGSAKENKEYLSTNGWNMLYIMNGAWFERLVSFMGFENAAYALVDEDQEDAVKAIFEKTTDLFMRIVDKVVEYFPEVDSIFMQEDWGTSLAPFFSEDVAERLFVPYMKRFTDYAKSKGIIPEIHSCGKNESRVPSYIHGGFQSWTPQPMNDSEKLFELYGDQIIITFNLEVPADMTEEEARQMARDFVRKHCVPGKALRVTINSNTLEYQKSIDGRHIKADREVVAANNLVAFEKELYIQSRKAYLSF